MVHFCSHHDIDNARLLRSLNTKTNRSNRVQPKRFWTARNGKTLIIYRLRSAFASAAPLDWSRSRSSEVHIHQKQHAISPPLFTTVYLYSIALKSNICRSDRTGRSRRSQKIQDKQRQSDFVLYSQLVWSLPTNQTCVQRNVRKV